MFFALNVHVGMVETIVQSIESKHFGIFKMLEDAFASPLDNKILQEEKRVLVGAAETKLWNRSHQIVQ